MMSPHHGHLLAPSCPTVDCTLIFVTKRSRRHTHTHVVILSFVGCGPHLRQCCAIDADATPPGDVVDLATSLDALGRVGWVDARHETALLKFQGMTVDDIVPYRVFPYGYEKESPSDYTTVDEAREAALATIPEELVTVLATDADVEPFLVAATRSGRIPAAIFTAKEGIPVLVTKVAMWFGDHFMFCVYSNPSENARERFGLKRLPQLHLLIPQGKEDGQLAFGSAPYERKQFGGMKFANVVRFLATARAELTKAGIFTQHSEAADEENEQRRRTAQEKLSRFEPNEIFQVTPDTSEYCPTTFIGLCVIAMLDGTPEAGDVRAGQLDILSSVQYLPANKGRPLLFMWLDGYCHAEVAQTFDVSADLLPSVVVISPKRKQFARWGSCHAWVGLL